MNNNQIIAIENAKIIYRNFTGEARKFNAEGNRNFNLVLTEEDCTRLTDIGFRVRVRPPRNDDEEPQYLLPVNVSFKVRPPKIVVISGRKRNELSELTVGELDHADIEHIDLTIRPYHWTMGDKSGVKAYLNSMYVTLVEDVFADRYSEPYETAEEPF